MCFFLYLLEIASSNIGHDCSSPWQSAFDMFRAGRQQKVQNIVHVTPKWQCANGLPVILIHTSFLPLKASPSSIHVTPVSSIFHLKNQWYIISINCWIEIYIYIFFICIHALGCRNLGGNWTCVWLAGRAAPLIYHHASYFILVPTAATSSVH